MSDGDVALALIHHVRQTATCTVCKLPFRNPCLLPACLHTFCRQCIQSVNIDYDADEESRSKVLCPQCSQETALSSHNGEEIAVKDYFANKLLESTGHLLNLNQCMYVLCFVVLMCNLPNDAVAIFEICASVFQPV